ncbi:hypothetical protein V5799_027884 [Amblyomma americanum]|uniref:Uncharacterized protein n=1 Tax=Amblyomma americanum TaxID=6943 RepID=A0AAQ4DEF9_AMBAM
MCSQLLCRVCGACTTGQSTFQPYAVLLTAHVYAEAESSAMHDSLPQEHRRPSSSSKNLRRSRTQTCIASNVVFLEVAVPCRQSGEASTWLGLIDWLLPVS